MSYASTECFGIQELCRHIAWWLDSLRDLYALAATSRQTYHYLTTDHQHWHHQVFLAHTRTALGKDDDAQIKDEVWRPIRHQRLINRLGDHSHSVLLGNDTLHHVITWLLDVSGVNDAFLCDATFPYYTLSANETLVKSMTFTVPRTLLASSCEHFSDSLNRAIEQRWPLVRRTRALLHTTQESKRGQPHYEVESMCPAFAAHRFWYDLLRFCGAATRGFQDFWLNHMAAQALSRTRCLQQLQVEYDETVTVMHKKYGTLHGIIPRLWSAHMAHDANKTVPLAVCDNTTCGTQRAASFMVHPFANANSGHYCSVWCAYDAAFAGSVLYCSGHGCKHSLTMLDAFGFSRYVHRHCGIIGGHKIFPNQDSVTQSCQYRLDRIVNLALSTFPTTNIDELYVQAHPVRPERCTRLSDHEWAARVRDAPALPGVVGSRKKTAGRRNRGEKLRMIPSLLMGYLGPHQSDLMPRLLLTTTSENPKLFCSRTCLARASAVETDATDADTGATTTIYCCNAACDKAFDVGYASGSFECQRLVFVNTKGVRELRGYVCDDACAFSYLRDLKAIRLARKRKHTVISPNSTFPPTKRTKRTARSTHSKT